MPRREPGAVVHDPDEVVKRALGMARDRTVTSRDGTRIAIAARSLCLHGDTPGAAELARRVRSELTAAGVRIRSFG